jgi:peptidyl-prolyl cis-trans isomerase C
MRSKLVLYVLAAAVAAGGCRKASEGQAATAAQTAATPAGSGQPAPPAPPKPVPQQLPDVVARVNGEPVKKDEFEQMLKTMERQAGQPIPAERRDEIIRNALDQMITYKVLSHESRNRGIKVEDADIEAKLADIKKQFPTEAAFQQALKDRNMTVEKVREDARVDLSVTRLMDAEVATVPGPSDAEAKDFYDKNPDKFKEPEQVRASHILVRVDEKADAATKKRARAEIDSVLKQIRSGGDFAKLAQEHSQDGSAAQGGDLDYFPRGKMVEPFNKVAFELKPGQVSDVVQTQFGYHIIKVVDHKDGRTVPFEEAQPRIKDYLTGQKKQQHADAFIDGLKKKFKVEVLI